MPRACASAPPSPTRQKRYLLYVQTAESVTWATWPACFDRLGQLASLYHDATEEFCRMSRFTSRNFQSLQDQLRSVIGGTTGEIRGTADITSPLGTFNGKALFGSTPGGGTTLTIGASAGQEMTIPDTDLRTGAMLSVIQQDASGRYTLGATDGDAISVVSDATQDLGAQRWPPRVPRNRAFSLAGDHAAGIQNQNLSSALSSIRDVDVAQESTRLAKYNILVQSAALAMLAQWLNQTPQSVLKLLQRR